MGELDGKVAIVTGAGRMRGTGHAIAFALAAAGCDVVLNGRGSAPESWHESERAAGWRGLESVAAEIRALGRRALPVIADVGRVDQVEAMVAQTIRELGRVDILVNNAAAPRGDDRVPVVELADASWHHVIEVKLHGAFYCSRAVARELVRRGEGGVILNISSIAGKTGGPSAAAYSVASAGMQMLGASMARELGPHNIRVNSLCIGTFATSRNYDMDRETWRAMLAAHVPLNRDGTLEEMGALAVFFCSAAGAYITGQSINIDGGWVIH
jgi:NAD(P)-dependent dehydrogenase (short-subunit alcohol dehydrogenase family)